MFATCGGTIPNLLLHDKPVPLSDQHCSLNSRAIRAIDHGLPLSLRKLTRDHYVINATTPMFYTNT
jgi:hypothetical protein